MEHDAEPSTLVGDHISHLAALTAQRDREMLDVSLAQGVLELLSASSVGVYRLVGPDDGAQRWLCCGLARRGELTVSDPPWVDLDSLPVVSAFPLRQLVLDSRLLEQAELPTASLIDPTQRFVTVLPLMVELGLPGVLEVMSDKPLAMESLKPIQTLLKVFANFQNLLESSQRDSLTGLLNRQTFDATFLKASMPSQPDPGHNGERRSSPATGYWLGVVDIDLFKLVNDRFGHLIGDEVLVLVARIMRQSFRHYDRLYRFGGEEFVVLLRGGTEDDAQQAYERFRRNVETYVFPQVNKVTISLGFTEVMHNDTPSVAFSRADQGVYQATHQGRNQVLCYEALVRDGVLKTEAAHVGDVELF
ncbi:GGDEF domain-containing protein [Aquabacterium sp.]|uniref:GGDEF domain-containing protein n=1 Tax=Aquabacterium sp. TaxID=1872578 RepID=UPI00262974CF|nr:GGDEF domain-containing protein [Aquabacterium sp.]MDD2976440.1 GGDEF domain-containing protein [Aquabacterium sp.]